MALPDVFSKPVIEQLTQRIDRLTPESQPSWGTMSVAQMLAHCNVTYEMLFTDKHPAPNFLMKLMLKAFVKNAVVNETPYPKNSRTAPAFLIKDERAFATEKQRLLDHLEKVASMGRAAFEGKASHSFGALTAEQWNNMFYKHLDHHLGQFGV
jgi:hypothetical protein